MQTYSTLRTRPFSLYSIRVCDRKQLPFSPESSTFSIPYASPIPTGGAL